MNKTDKPRVLIVGAGLAGLFLGGLLERSDVPYTIFERAASVKPVGSGMIVGPALIPTFQQLGIYDDLLAIGLRMDHCVYYKESMEPYKPTDVNLVHEFTGYYNYVVPRPKLYEILLKVVPAHKIQYGKRVLKIVEEEDKVMVHTSDNGVHKGDIVVGADGAYSAVRQRLYEQLKAKGELPESDHEDLPFSTTCLVGQTEPLDPEEFPIVKEQYCQFLAMLGKDKPFTWTVMSTSSNRLAWYVVHHLNEKTSKAAMEQRFRNNDNAEWGAYPAQVMCEETRNFPIPLEKGKKHTLGDLFDRTPKELISKVMLEEKVFKTWYSGRTVLIGDACHKLNPAGALGAVTAMHDALALANLLYAMPTGTSQDVTKVFNEYQKERLPAVMEAFNYSQGISNILGRGIFGAIYLYIMTHMPTWLWRIVLSNTVKFRPQAGFLKAIEVMGNIKPATSLSEQKARAVYEMQLQDTVASI
ncbi:hypothetical protein EC957_005623 [Mortierella hygrophila]|uniref:FAD-binding domain-containing protein n=1 Tax=Mortierella hygrophila TaxID=979708 RepID=A0A9P6F0W8_9FUNG|nr:hypothetical protein EC957_005623 [Mortierella hygrophila]